MTSIRPVPAASASGRLAQILDPTVRRAEEFCRLGHVDFGKSKRRSAKYFASPARPGKLGKAGSYEDHRQLELNRPVDRGRLLLSQAVLSVKSGKPSVRHVRELRGVVEDESAEIGVLITMQEPTRAMREAAATAGFYRSGSEGVGTWGQHPKIQILTVRELLNGVQIDKPPRTGNLTFRRGKRAERLRLPRTEPLFKNLADAPEFRKVFEPASS